MASTTPHELAYDIERVVERHLKRLKVPKPKTVAQDIAPEIMREIPSEAFDPKQPWSTGKLFFHGDVWEDHVRETQYEIAATHENLKPSIPLTLYLSSFGGDCYAGLALISTIQEIRRAGRRVNVHIQGCAMSMGSLIAQVGDFRTIEPQAWFMIHEPATRLPWSKTSAVKDEAEIMERLEQQMFALYATRTGKSIEYWRKRCHRKDLFLSAKEALDEGLVDAIASTPLYPRQRRKKAA